MRPIPSVLSPCGPRSSAMVSPFLDRFLDTFSTAWCGTSSTAWCGTARRSVLVARPRPRPVEVRRGGGSQQRGVGADSHERPPLSQARRGCDPVIYHQPAGFVVVPGGG